MKSYKVKDLKKTYEYIHVRHFDLVILLMNYLWHHEKHGNMDAVRSFEEVRKQFDTRKWLKTPDVEALLYCANMLNEEGEFWHPDGIEFEEWVKRAFDRADFDRVYNFFKETKDAG